MLQTVIRWLLAISLLANLVLGVLFFRQHDGAVEAKTEERQAVASAQACSQGVDQLQQQAQQRQSAAAPKIAAAASAARAADRLADEIMRMPPADPGDACRSAVERVNSWWKGKPR
jgi:hypothetical protein